MRILLFGPYPRPGQPITGGVMAVMVALARGLATQGLEVGVASATARGDDGEDREDGITIYRRGIPPLPRARGHRTIRRKLVAVAHDFRPTLIHAHGTGYYAAAALDGPWPVILTAHGVVYEEARRSQARGIKERLAWRYDTLLEKRVLTRARHVIAINPYIRQAFAQYDHLQWVDIPNPVDEAFFQITREPEPGLLFTPARVIPRKGIDILIRALAQVAEAHPHARLQIAGETTTSPGFVAHCRELAARAGISDRVQFLGNLDREALLAAYRRAWVMVLPSRQETAPVAIGEALATGCPVIATQVGGVPWMVHHEQEGLLVPPEDVDALAAALARALSQEEVVRAWSQRARLTAQPYRLAAVLDATLAAYRAVWAQSSPDRAVVEETVP